jgi:hypothetical protein
MRGNMMQSTLLYRARMEETTLVWIHNGRLLEARTFLMKNQLGPRTDHQHCHSTSTMTTHSFRQRDAQASADPSINAIDTISRDREISCTECLLLTQAAYEYGSDWASIAQLLQAHPLIKPPKDFFSQDVCQSLYKKLLLNAGMSLCV